jgi:hypothetical protein
MQTKSAPSPVKIAHPLTGLWAGSTPPGDREPTITLRLKDGVALLKAADRYLQEWQDDGSVRLASWELRKQIRLARRGC